MDFAFGIMGLALLVGALVLGYFAAQTTNPLVASGIWVKGSVIRNELQLGHAVVFRPVVRFTTRDNKVMEVKYDKGLATLVPQFAVGRVVWLVYNPSNYFDILILSD